MRNGRSVILLATLLMASGGRAPDLLPWPPLSGISGCVFGVDRGNGVPRLARLLPGSTAPT
jgi:hypothetical protein